LQCAEGRPGALPGGAASRRRGARRRTPRHPRRSRHGPPSPGNPAPAMHGAVLRQRAAGRTCAPGESMLDVILLAATVAFFAVSIAYVRACDRL